jgi:hypothetical protein
MTKKINTGNNLIIEGVYERDRCVISCNYNQKQYKD